MFGGGGGGARRLWDGGDQGRERNTEWFICGVLLLHFSGMRMMAGLLLGLLYFILQCVDQAQAQCAGSVLGDQCFTVAQGGDVSYSEAATQCSSLGASLPVVRDKDTADFIQDVMEEQGVQSVWLAINHQARDWFWISDDEFVGEQGCYKDWNRPDFHDLPESFTFADDKLTPTRCIDKCRQEGFTYAGTQSGYACYCGDTYGKYGQEKGESQFCTVACTGDPDLWCGGWYRNTIYRVDGSYVQWQYKSPNNINGYQTCAALGEKAQDYKFTDMSCYEALDYICNIPDSECGNGTSYSSAPGHCVFLSETTASWFVAREDCVDRGGDLLKITDSTHHGKFGALLTDLNRLTNQHWTGLTQEKWTWSGGSDVIFTNWQTARPNGKDMTSKTHCAAVIASENYQWTDQDCSETFHTALCQISLASTTSTDPLTDTTLLTTTAEQTTSEPLTTALKTTTASETGSNSNKGSTTPTTTSGGNNGGGGNSGGGGNTGGGGNGGGNNGGGNSDGGNSGGGGNVVTEEPDTGGNGTDPEVDPNVGESKKADDGIIFAGLTLFQLLIIGGLVLLAIAIVLSVGIFVCYKKSHSTSRVTPEGSEGSTGKVNSSGDPVKPDKPPEDDPDATEKPPATPVIHYEPPTSNPSDARASRYVAQDPPSDQT